MSSARTRPLSPRSGGWSRTALIALLLTTVGCGPREQRHANPELAEGTIPVGNLLAGEDATGFARATGPTPFAFPRDHGPHPNFRSEWWYLTGILRGRDATGAVRRFGYQLTLFRQAMTAEGAARSSAWATRDLYMGHMAVADIDGPGGNDRHAADARFQARQRLARDGLGLAGAQSSPFAVWVEGWRIAGAAAEDDAALPLTGKSSAPPNSGSGRHRDVFPLHVSATDGMTFAGTKPPDPLAASLVTEGGGGAPAVTPLGLSLSVAAGRGPILQGDRGYSVKGSGAGNASFYYSATRLPTRGQVATGGHVFTVEGTSWLDREWSTSALEPGIVGWDWLGVHLADGRDLMLYRLRRADGTMATVSRATLIDADGSTRQFDGNAFKLEPRGSWESADGRARYPAGFRLTIPAEKFDVTIQPLLADQELLLAVRYWEGAVSLTGTAAGGPVAGEGYLEMTGYAPTGARVQR